MDLITIMKRYNTEGKCYSLLEKLKWPDGPVCPHCGSKRASKRKDNRYNCNKCNCSYSVLHDTIFEASKIPLQKWFIGISLILNAKKGISSLQLARDLKVNRKTAWFLQSRIRSGMKEEDEILNGVVEADETYIGGSLENQHYFKKRKKERLNKTGFSHKDTVLGMIQRKGKIIVGLLDFWTFGHLDIWTFGHLDIWTFGRLDIWTFGRLDIWTFGHLDIWTFGQKIKKN